jgi:hypothetical protein
MEISFVCVECDYRSSNWEQINVYGFLCSFLPKEPSRNIRRKESTELKWWKGRSCQHNWKHPLPTHSIIFSYDYGRETRPAKIIHEPTPYRTNYLDKPPKREDSTAHGFMFSPASPNHRTITNIPQHPILTIVKLPAEETLLMHAIPSLMMIHGRRRMMSDRGHTRERERESSSASFPPISQFPVTLGVW